MYTRQLLNRRAFHPKWFLITGATHGWVHMSLREVGIGGTYVWFGAYVVVP